MFNFLSGVAGRTEVEAGLEAIATELAAVALGLAVGLTAVIVTVNNYYVCGGYDAATIAPIIARIITVTDNCFDRDEREERSIINDKGATRTPAITTVGIGFDF